MDSDSPDLPKLPAEPVDEIGRLAERRVFDARFADVLEVTFAYDALPHGGFFNRTLFSDFAGLSPQDDPRVLLEGAVDALRGRQKAARELRERLGSADGVRAQVLAGALDYAAGVARFVELGAAFEAQKAGLDLGWDEAATERRVLELEAAERGLFGGNLRDFPDECAGALDLLRERMALEGARPAGAKRVSAEKYAALGRAADAFARLIPAGTPAWNRRARRHGHGPELDRPVARATYVAIFREALAAYGLAVPVVVERRGGVYDGPGCLRIPSGPAYAVMSAERVLRLVAHEIETHYLTEANHVGLFGGIRGGWNLPREEGLAMWTECRSEGVEPDGMDWRPYPALLAAETMGGDEFAAFVEAWEAVNRGDAETAHDARLRRKRCYPLGHRGAQHKDMAYDRGLREVARWAAAGKDVGELYVGKVSFEQVAPALALAHVTGFVPRRPAGLAMAVRRALEAGRADWSCLPPRLAEAAEKILALLRAG